MNDLDLLRQYTQEASEEAFATLVQRHLNLVYATALRQVRSPQLAEDVSQSVFFTLAKNARTLRRDTILAAWLYRVTRCAAIDVARGESRRQQREQIALDLANMKSDSPEWMRIEGLLDEVLETLEEPDRNAILLRFFQNKSLREVGEILGTSEEAARKRVSRAVEQLRSMFAQRGIAVGAAGLVALLGAQALHAAPVGLSVTISAVAFSGAAAIHPVTTIAATKAIAMTVIQKTLITTAFAAAVGTGLYEARQASHYQEEALAAKQQQDALAQQNLQLQNERDDATNQIATLKSEASKFRSNTSELVKLRREVSRLRDASKAVVQRNASAAEVNDPIDSTMKSWADRSKKLKEMIAQTPNQQIPEFKLLKDQDWLDAVKNVDQLNTDADYAKAVDALKSAARNEFAGAVQNAFNQFAQNNSGQSPTDFAQIKTYLGDAGDDSILQGYQFAGPGQVYQKPNFQTDADGNFYASSLQISQGGSVSSSVNSGDDLKQPILAFAAANPGQSITDPAQLLPYVQTEAEKKALQQVIQTPSPQK